MWFSTATAALEIIRRVIWTLLRVEAEHTTNVGKMRAFDDAPLPSLERARLASMQGWHQSDDSWRGAVRRGTGTGLGRRLAKASSGRHDRHVSYRVDLMAATTVT